MKELANILMGEVLKIPWKDYAGIWGGIVATILAILKIREEYRDRHHLVISPRLTGNPDDADVISITNLSKRRVLIDYFELYYKTKGLFGKKKLLISPEDEIIDISIDTNSRKDLEFRDQYKINLSANRKLYIRLHVIGKKPKTFFVC